MKITVHRFAAKMRNLKHKQLEIFCKSLCMKDNTFIKKIPDAFRTISFYKKLVEQQPQLIEHIYNNKSEIHNVDWDDLWIRAINSDTKIISLVPECISNKHEFWKYINVEKIIDENPTIISKMPKLKEIIVHNDHIY